MFRVSLISKRIAPKNYVFVIIVIAIVFIIFVVDIDIIIIIVDVTVANLSSLVVATGAITAYLLKAFGTLLLVADYFEYCC